MQLILGGGQMTAGDITIDGYSMELYSDSAKQRLAYVLEECPFSLRMTAQDNGKLYGECYDTWNWDTFRTQCERFAIPMDGALNRLSKGERVLFQLAFALSYDAKLYVMDEPTAGLDASYQQILLDAMQEIVEDGTRSVIYVTQKLADFEQIGDYVLWLKRGKQVLFEEKEKLLDGYRILHGTEKQLRYIGKREPERLLITRYLPHGSEAFVRASAKPYALKLDERKPTLEELLYYCDAYHKKYYKHLISATQLRESV
jgi:ABC-2 type transport system ATP-binding protein